MEEATTGLFLTAAWGLGLGSVEGLCRQKPKEPFFARNSEIEGPKQCCFRVQVRKTLLRVHTLCITFRTSSELLTWAQLASFSSVRGKGHFFLLKRFVASTTAVLGSP